MSLMELLFIAKYLSLFKSFKTDISVSLFLNKYNFSRFLNILTPDISVSSL